MIQERVVFIQVPIIRASDISRKKKAKFRGIFRGKFAEKSANFAGFSREKSQNSREKQAISGIFPGKKSKFAEKSADFAGFSREKSQNSRKNRPTSRDFSGKTLSTVNIMVSAQFFATFI